MLSGTGGLHNRQVFEVTEFPREGAQPGAEGASLLAVFLPTGLQTSTQALTEAPKSAPEMIPDEAVEHGVDGRIGEAQAESERGEVFVSPGYPAAIQPALALQEVYEGHTVKGEPAEEECDDHRGYCPQHSLQPPPLLGSGPAVAGTHTGGRGSVWFIVTLLGLQ